MVNPLEGGKLSGLGTEIMKPWNIIHCRKSQHCFSLFQFWKFWNRKTNQLPEYFITKCILPEINVSIHSSIVCTVGMTVHCRSLSWFNFFLYLRSEVKFIFQHWYQGNLKLKTVFNFCAFAICKKVPEELAFCCSSFGMTFHHLQHSYSRIRCNRYLQQPLVWYVLE